MVDKFLCELDENVREGDLFQTNLDGRKVHQVWEIHQVLEEGNTIIMKRKREMEARSDD